MSVKPNQAYSTRITGDVMMTVRADTAASEASAVNKYHPVISDSIGRVWTAATSTGGSVADGATVTSINPVIVGAEARNTSKLAVDNGDAVRLQADIQGRLVVTGAQRELTTVKQTSTTTTNAIEIVTAGGANVFTDLVTLIVTNSSATAANVTISDGTATVLVMHARAESNEIFHFGLVPIKQSAANIAWTATSGTAVTSIQITTVTAVRSDATV